ncbi:hypothetical protein DINM_005843 [Dirofilaria immitis]|nr:hypothetical protein [Dirofilaria immitis]
MIAYKDHCSFLEKSATCSILSEIGLALLKSFRYAFVAITVERFIAMCCYQQYEKWKYPIALAFLPLMWIEIALDIKRIVSTGFESKNIYKVIVHLSSILTLRLKTPMDTLSSRYQIRENMKTSKTMFIATIIVDYMRNKAIKCLSYFGCHITNRVGEELVNQPLSVRQHIEIVSQMWEKEARHK